MNTAQTIAINIVTTAVMAGMAARGHGLDQLTERVRQAYGKWATDHSKHDGDHVIERAQLRVDVYDELQEVGFMWEGH